MLSVRTTLELNDFRVLKARTLNVIENAAEDAANDGAEAAKTSAKATTKFRDRSGRLRGSIGMLAARRAGKFWDALVQATAKHAAHVEWGTRPHVIKARKKPMLIFWWEKMGFLFVGKKVRHPGTQPTWFMSLAARKGYYAMIDSAKRVEQRVAAIWR